MGRYPVTAAWSPGFANVVYFPAQAQGLTGH